MRDLMRISVHELYFYAPMVVSVLRSHGAVIEEPMMRWLHEHPQLLPLPAQASVPTPAPPGWWMDVIEEAVGAYRAAAQALMDEELETQQATRTLPQQLASITEWRQMMVSWARLAPKADRKAMLAAAGHGMGRIRTLAQAQSFLLTVQARVATRADSFRTLGVRPATLRFPAQALAQLAHTHKLILREQAEDTLARHQRHLCRDRLLTLLRQVHLCTRAVVAEAEILGDHDRHHRAHELLQILKADLQEARRSSARRRRKRTRTKAPAEPA